MLKRTEKLVISFHTTAAAMAMEGLCRELGMDGRLIPVPGTITADCGLAWRADVDSEAALKEVMAVHGIDFQGIYRCMI